VGILRFILALAVVVAHSGSFFGIKLTGGLVAVEMFFIISGFYMSMILSEKYKGKGSYSLFVSNRFLRIYPMFWGMLILIIATSVIQYLTIGEWGALSFWWENSQLMNPFTIFMQIFAHIAIIGQDMIMFLGVDNISGEMFFTNDFSTTNPKFYKFLLVPQAWTLGIEVTFYLIAPFIVRKSNLVIFMMIFASLLIRAFTYFYLGYMNDPWTYRFFPSELALFLFGTISYRIYLHIEKLNFLTEKRQLAVITLFFSTIIFYQFIPFKSGYVSHVINWSLYVITILILPLIFNLSKKSKLDGRIGEYSFPIYISHMFIITLTMPFFDKLGLAHFSGEIIIVETMIISTLLIKLVADPIERIRRARVYNGRLAFVDK
jgi:peptidoglycan/LPS O-acetylase OafA/YrhL